MINKPSFEISFRKTITASFCRVIWQCAPTARNMGRHYQNSHDLVSSWRRNKTASRRIVCSTLYATMYDFDFACRFSFVDLMRFCCYIYMATMPVLRRNVDINCQKAVDPQAQKYFRHSRKNNYEIAWSLSANCNCIDCDPLDPFSTRSGPSDSANYTLFVTNQRAQWRR